MNINSKEEREEIKNEAIELRESGNLEKALILLKQVKDWDEKNSNLKGKSDVMGHIRITYNRLADSQSDPNKKEEFQRQAATIAEETLKFTEENKLPSEIAKVHLAGALCAYSENLDEGEARFQMQEKALILLNEAIVKLPGSAAHKAWPAATKAKVLYLMGKKVEALQVLANAQILLYEGYGAELKEDDQAEIKLNSWLSGIFLTFAWIYIREKKIILAKNYATAVVSIDDPKNTLGERKREAQRILDSINS